MFISLTLSFHSNDIFSRVAESGFETEEVTIKPNPLIEENNLFSGLSEEANIFKAKSTGAANNLSNSIQKKVEEGTEQIFKETSEAVGKILIGSNTEVTSNVNNSSLETNGGNDTSKESGVEQSNTEVTEPETGDINTEQEELNKDKIGEEQVNQKKEVTEENIYGNQRVEETADTENKEADYTSDNDVIPEKKQVDVETESIDSVASTDKTE
ncbi:hypothetical protein CDIK_2246 [Cucumispora dikerogammari]|nr:hypothetical protein CDIK_2246 [Cucumispora dikerogammari]